MRIYSYATNHDAIRAALGEELESVVGAVILPVYNAPDDQPLAVVLEIDPLDHQGEAAVVDVELLRSLPTRSIVLWTGSLAPEPFGRDIHTWGPMGQRAFAELVRQLREPLTGAGKRVLWRPHARHVISDVQRALSFLLDEQRTEPNSPFGLALDLGSLLEPSMLDVGQDHLGRALEALGDHVDLVLATGYRERPLNARASAPSAEPSGDLTPLEPVGVHEGDLEPAALGAMIRRHLPPETPLVLLAKDLDEQLRAMGLVSDPVGP